MNKEVFFGSFFGTGFGFGIGFLACFLFDKYGEYKKQLERNANQNKKR